MLNRDEFEQLYRESEQQLFNVAYRWAWNRDQARELVHEAFIRVWSRRVFIDPERARAYLVATLVNLCRQLARKRTRWQRVREALGLAVEHPPGPEQDYRQRQLREAIEALPDGMRHALLLSEFSDLGQREIGALLGIPAGTVASRRNTAIRRLRQRLKAPDE